MPHSKGQGPDTPDNQDDLKHIPSTTGNERGASRNPVGPNDETRNNNANGDADLRGYNFNETRQGYNRDIDSHIEKAKEYEKEKKYGIAIKFYDLAFAILNDKNEKSSEDIRKLCDLTISIADCYHLAKKDFKAIKHIEGKMKLLNNLPLKNEDKIELLILAIDYSIEALKDINISEKCEDSILNKIDTFILYIQKIKLNDRQEILTSKSKLTSLTNNTREAFGKINTLEAYQREKLLQLLYVCLTTFLTFEKIYAKLPNNKNQYLGDLINLIELDIAILENKEKKENEQIAYALNKALEYYNEKNNLAKYRETFLKAKKLYLKNGDIKGLQDLLYTAFFNTYDKLNKLETKKVSKKDKKLFSLFFRITREAIDAHLFITMQYDWADKYASSLIEMMSSKKARKILGIDFSKVLDWSKKKLKNVYEEKEYFLTNYLLTLHDISNTLSSKNVKISENTSKINKANERLLNIIEEKEDAKDYTLIALNILNKLIVAGNIDINKANEKLRNIEQYVKEINEAGIYASYIQVKLEYNYRFNKINCKKKTRLLFKNFLNLCKQDGSLIYGYKYFETIFRHAEFLIDKAKDYKRAKEAIDLLEDYIEEKNLHNSKQNLICLEYKMTLYKNLGLDEEYKKVKKEYNKVRKYLENL